MHLYFCNAVALTSLTSTALHIERKPPAVVAAHAGRREAGEEVANPAECAGVGDGIAARRAADWRLVDDDGLVDVLEAEDGLVSSRLVLCPVKVAEQRASQNIIHERAFSAAADAGHARDAPERKTRGDVLEIVFARADDGEPAVGGPIVDRFGFRTGARCDALLRNGNLRLNTFKAVNHRLNKDQREINS